MPLAPGPCGLPSVVASIVTVMVADADDGRDSLRRRFEDALLVASAHAGSEPGRATALLSLHGAMEWAAGKLELSGIDVSAERSLLDELASRIAA